MIYNVQHNCLTEDLQFFINIRKGICSSSTGGDMSREVAVINGNLYIYIDDSFLYQVDLNGKVDPSATYIVESYHPPYTNANTDKDTMTDYLGIQDNTAIDRIQSVLQPIIHSIGISDVIYTDPTVSEDPQFVKATIENKVSDGHMWYFCKADGCNPFIPLFKGFPKLTKSDKVGITLYRMAEPNVILVEMNIYKHKFKINCKLFYKILDVNRPLML